MESWDNLKPLWEKVLAAMHADKKKLKLRCGVTEINAENLERAIGNHLLDDKPELFGITAYEGHVLRQYIHEAVYHGYVHVELLHWDFPQFMEKEDPRYFRDYVNPGRIHEGLVPLDPKKFC